MATRKNAPPMELIWDLEAGQQEEELFDCLAAMSSLEEQAEDSDEDAPSAWMTANRCDYRYYHIDRLPAQRRSESELAAGVNEVEENICACLSGQTDECGNYIETVFRHLKAAKKIQAEIGQLKNPAPAVRLRGWNYNPRRNKLLCCLGNEPQTRRLDLPVRRNRPTAPQPKPTPKQDTTPETDNSCPLDWSDI